MNGKRGGPTGTYTAVRLNQEHKIRMARIALAQEMPFGPGAVSLHSDISAADRDCRLDGQGPRCGNASVHVVSFQPEFGSKCATDLRHDQITRLPFKPV